MVSPHEVMVILAGAWSLLNTTGYRDGVPLNSTDPALGHRPIGQLTYTLRGYMSATLMSSDAAYRPSNLSYPTNETDTQPDSLWAQLGKHTLFYAGPYSVNTVEEGKIGLEGVLVHGPMTVALAPSWVGSAQTRNFTVFSSAENNDVLRISAFDSKTGILAELYWGRLTKKM